MKGLFIAFESISNYTGIGKKIKAQVDSLNNIGVETSLVYFTLDSTNNFAYRYVDDILIENYTFSIPLINKNIWRIQFNKLFDYISHQKLSFIYIRYIHFANPFFNHFLKKLKKINIQILMEIPTYPYDSEYKNLKLRHKIIKRTEEHYRRYFHKYIDLVVTYSNAEEIFKIKTIKINNGIDLDKINLRKMSKDKGTLNLVAVAVLAFWHGYDRVIEGLKEYYSFGPDLKIVLHIVGNNDNEESKKYKILVEKYKLEDYVIFHGLLTGPDLDKIFDISDLALGCLGVHRKGITYIKSLKNSEYCARGIPFVYSEIDDTFEGQPFIFKVSPNDDPINISQLIRFIYSPKPSPGEIRKYAEKVLSWDIQMNKIMQSLDSNRLISNKA